MEKQTKKLGDFTIREASEICGNCIDCTKCPFYNTGWGALVCIFKEDDLGDVLPSELEQEINLGCD